MYEDEVVNVYINLVNIPYGKIWKCMNLVLTCGKFI